MAQKYKPFTVRGKLLLLLLTVAIIGGATLYLTQTEPPEAPPLPTPTPTFLLIEEAMELLPTEVLSTPVPTPNPVPTPSATPEITPQPPKLATLRKGDKSDDVRRMQRELSVLGYLGNDAADGDFGKGTEAAVKAFQRRNGLKVDGVAGQETLTRLFGDEATPAR